MYTPQLIQQLFNAIKFGNMDTVQSLLDQNVPLDVRDNSGITPLHLAIMKSKTEIAILVAQKMKDQGTSLDTTVDLIVRGKQSPIILKKITPLHLASLVGNKKVVAVLLNLGANPSSRCAAGLTFFDYASEYYNYRKQGIEVEGIEIDSAESSKQEIAEFITNFHYKSFNPNNNRTLLHELAKNNDTNFISLVIAANCMDLLAKDIKGNTFVDYLLPQNRGKYEKLILLKATEKGDIETISKMVYANRNIYSLYETELFTPLYVAITKNQKEAVSFFLKSRAGLNWLKRIPTNLINEEIGDFLAKMNYQDCKPLLHVFAEQNDVNTMIKLLQLGASPIELDFAEKMFIALMGPAICSVQDLKNHADKFKASVGISRFIIGSLTCLESIYYFVTRSPKETFGFVFEEIELLLSFPEPTISIYKDKIESLGYQLIQSTMRQIKAYIEQDHFLDFTKLYRTASHTLKIINLINNWGLHDALRSEIVALLNQGNKLIAVGRRQINTQDPFVKSLLARLTDSSNKGFMFDLHFLAVADREQNSLTVIRILEEAIDEFTKLYENLSLGYMTVDKAMIYLESIIRIISCSDTNYDFYSIFMQLQKMQNFMSLEIVQKYIDEYRHILKVYIKIDKQLSKLGELISHIIATNDYMDLQELCYIIDKTRKAGYEKLFPGSIIEFNKKIVASMMPVLESFQNRNTDLEARIDYIINELQEISPKPINFVQLIALVKFISRSKFINLPKESISTVNKKMGKEATV